MIVNLLPKRCGRALPAPCPNLAAKLAPPAVIKHRDLAAILKIHFNGAGIATSEIDGIEPMLARAVKIGRFQRSVAGDLHPAGGATAGWKTWHAKCSPGKIDLYVAQSRIGLIYELDGQ